jgi:Cu(I)/Ag(I) efflux system membrane fusion protein
MYAEVEIDAAAGDGPSLAVPASAVIDSGRRQVVIVDRGEGRFEPRQVKLGLRGDGLIEVRDGIRAGDKVVVAANFLIDAESNLKAALSGFTAEASAPPDGKRSEARPSSTREAGGSSRSFPASRPSPVPPPGPSGEEGADREKDATGRTSQ